MIKSSPSLLIREMKVKTIMRYLNVDRMRNNRNSPRLLIGK